jgi:hypothetical protein
LTSSQVTHTFVDIDEIDMGAVRDERSRAVMDEKSVA